MKLMDYGLGHERRQGSALAIVVDDTFLYIGMLFLEFLEDFSLRGLRIEGQQLVYECFYPVKALFGVAKSSSSSTARTRAP